MIYLVKETHQGRKFCKFTPAPDGYNYCFGVENLTESTAVFISLAEAEDKLKTLYSIGFGSATAPQSLVDKMADWI